MTQVFLSHSTQNAPFAQRIANDLRAAGVPVWKAPESIRPGESWVEALEHGLTTSTHILLLMSPAAVASRWVNWEFDFAMMLYAQRQIVILPVDYQPCDAPLRWRQFHSISGIGVDYNKALLSLIKQFRAEQPQNPPSPAEPTTTINIHVGGDVTGTINVGWDLTNYATRPAEPPPIPGGDGVPVLEIVEPEQESIDPVDIYELACAEQAKGDFETALQLLERLRQDAPDFIPEHVAGQIAEVERLIEYQQAYERVRRLVDGNHTQAAAWPLWMDLRREYPDILHDPNNLIGRYFGVPGVLPSPFDWIEIPAGRVIIEGSPGSYIAKGKTRTYEVKHFMIAKYPVTNAQFQIFVEAGNGYREAGWWDYSDEAAQWRSNHEQRREPEWGDLPNHPCVNVTWFEAVAFCRWLSEVVGNEVRLPTEPEWQRAAQGDDGRIYPWGKQEPDENLANFGKKVGRTTPVGSYPEGYSPYGVLDMAGNVWEWCSTDFEKGRDEVGEAASYRVLRGGAWSVSAFGIRAIRRFRGDPFSEGNHLGFRLACPCEPY
jgi:formylglycine-generating enzyme required for sulfatase activity